MTKRLLIIEDDIFMRDMLSLIVEDGGFSVVGADDGAQALAILQQDQDFAAIISDLYLPDCKGVELFQSVQQAAPAIPFMILSGESDDVIVAEAKQLGIVYVVKDMNVADTLLTTIEHLIM